MLKLVLETLQLFRLGGLAPTEHALSREEKHILQAEKQKRTHVRINIQEKGVGEERTSFLK